MSAKLYLRLTPSRTPPWRDGFKTGRGYGVVEYLISTEKKLSLVSKKTKINKKKNIKQGKGYSW